MLRGLAEAAFLFLLPFLGYVLLLLLQRRFPFMRNAWTRGPLSVMVVLGLALAVAGALLWGLFSPRHLGSYVPAHIEGGRLVPGRIE